MKNIISTFKKEKHDIITFVGRKFGFYLSLDFKKYEDDEMSKAMEMMQIIKQEKPPYRPKKKTAA